MPEQKYVNTSIFGAHHLLLVNNSHVERWIFVVFTCSRYQYHEGAKFQEFNEEFSHCKLWMVHKTNAKSITVDELNQTSTLYLAPVCSTHAVLTSYMSLCPAHGEVGP